MSSNHLTAGIDTVAAGQLGLVTIAQLREYGLTLPQVRRRVVNGALIVVRPTVYRLAGAPISWEQTVLAAVLRAGDGAVISHTTAAAVWSLRHSDRYSAGMHISGPRARIEGVTTHPTSLTAKERTSTGAIPVTTTERTIIDLAGMHGVLSAKQLGQCVDDAIRRKLLDLERLRSLAADVRARRGCRQLAQVHKVLADRIPGYRPDDSDFETKMNRLWEALGLPQAQRQYRLSIDGHSYRLDRAIVECRIGTEWDSHRHHSTPSDRDYDSNRRARLVSAGWLIIPVTTNTEPELIARAVRRAYLDRSGSGVQKACALTRSGGSDIVDPLAVESGSI